MKAWTVTLYETEYLRYELNLFIIYSLRKEVPACRRLWIMVYAVGDLALKLPHNAEKCEKCQNHDDWKEIVCYN